jgi:thiol:disulfide interchange protein DsbC
MKKLLGAMILGVSAAAGAAPTVAAVQAAVPGIARVQAVNPTPMRGLYEVVTDTSIIFVDDSLTHFMLGEMFDIKSKKNLTAPTLKRLDVEMARKDAAQESELLAHINLAHAFVEKKGNGQRIIYLVTDPACPYCKKLELTLDAVTNVTIHRFMVPFHGASSTRSATATWCSKNKLETWRRELAGESSQATTCDTPLQQNLLLARALKVEGTPTMFTPDGRKVSGALSKKDLEAWLDSQPAKQ